jgi:hypothetical protein
MQNSTFIVQSAAAWAMPNMARLKARPGSPLTPCGVQQQGHNGGKLFKVETFSPECRQKSASHGLPVLHQRIAQAIEIIFVFCMMVYLK